MTQTYFGVCLALFGDREQEQEQEQGCVDIGGSEERVWSLYGWVWAKGEGIVQSFKSISKRSINRTWTDSILVMVP